MDIDIKKAIVLISIFYTNIFLLISQDINSNLIKYWKLRDNFERGFIVIGSPEKQGTNLPATKRHFNKDNWIFWQQNPILFDFSPYICVLATEYRLLKDYGQDQTAAETLQKLIYTLATFDRLDANAEKFFRARKAGLKENDPNFWTKVEQYKDNSDFNGFFLRCDVFGYFPPPELLDDYDKPFNSTEIIDNSIDILTYNNNQLTIDEYNNTKPITNVSSPLRNYKYPSSKDPFLMSVDEIVGVYLALCFVYKFVDDNTLFTDTQGNRVTARQWARNIAIRLTNFLNNYKFVYKNPIDNDYPVGSFMISYAYPIKKIMNNHFGCNYKIYPQEWLVYSSTLSIFIDNLFIGSLFNKNAGNVPALHFLISAISGETAYMVNIPNKISFYQNIFINFSDMNNCFSGEFYLLIFTLLNSDFPLDGWIDKLDIKKEFYTKENLKNDIEQVLNSVPSCGLYFDCTNPIENWGFQRLIGCKPICESYEKGYENNLMFFFLHNVYWLVFQKNNNNVVFVTKDYPTFWGEGSIHNPVTINANVIYANNILDKNSKVHYSATNSISLTNGFQAKAGSFFYANISGTNLKYQYIYSELGCFYSPHKSLNFSDSNRKKELGNDILSIDFISQKQDFADNSIIVYPNPVKDILYLSVIDNMYEEYDVFILNNNGSCVLATKLNINSFIDVSSLHTGIYFIKVVNRNQTKIFKILKI